MFTVPGSMFPPVIGVVMAIVAIGLETFVQGIVIIILCHLLKSL